MKEEKCMVLENRKIAKNTYYMKLSQKGDSFKKAGTFFNIALPGHFLRRPFSLSEHEDGSYAFVYKTVGHGTEEMSRMKKGEILDVLLGLGNGFDLEKAGAYPLLLGGGSGVGVMYCLAKELLRVGITPSVGLGFNTKEEIFFEEEFNKLGIAPQIATVDGSYGVKGFVTEAMEEGYTYLYACGPEGMLKAIDKKALTSGEYSLERRMGCGYGCCMGCTIVTKNSPKRVCKEGPVFPREEIVW